MNTNKRFTEVEPICFRCGKCLVRRSNSLTFRISENPGEEEDRGGESVFVCVRVKCVAVSAQRQWQEESMGFPGPNRRSSSGEFILSHSIPSARRWGRHWVCLYVTKWLLMELLLAWQVSLCLGNISPKLWLPCEWGLCVHLCFCVAHRA